MISIIKHNLHKDICRDPKLHAFVLNLYLNGEEYPHKVNDYFPRHVVRDEALLQLMDAHMADEDRHVLLYRKAIRMLDQPVVELPMADVYNHVIKEHTPEHFQVLDSDDTDQQTYKLAGFMAHLHFLEKRIAQSLDYHAEACQHSAVDYTEKAVNKVRSDEKRHVTYTKDAVFDLLPRQVALRVMDDHRLAEKRANIQFSYQQLRKVVDCYHQGLSSGHRWVYRLSARFLEWSLKYA